jgi:hypothetical protein
MSRWIAIDPGESTGWALWEGDELLQAGTTSSWEFVDALDAALRGPGPVAAPALVWDFQNVEKIVMEDWALYPWAAQALIWDRQLTVRLIGAIMLLARQYGIELVMQPAKIKDSAEAGGAESYFLRPLHPNRHANDATRHGAYYIQTHPDEFPR